MEELKMDKVGYDKYLKEILKVEQQLNKIRHFKGEVAIFQGDGWHDNPTLYQTEMEERGLMSKLSDMREQLKHIKIVENSNDDMIVDIGDVINIAISVSSNESKEMLMKLVGYTGDIKAEISEISINSPLGASVYKKKIGENSSYKVGDRQFSVRILEKVKIQIENDSTKKKIK